MPLLLLALILLLMVDNICTNRKDDILVILRKILNTMTNERLIKKYPNNRRLYDTSTSSYITLEEVRQLVLEEIPFKVIDKKDGKNITRNILMQIIMEQENDGEPLFTVDMLNNFIRNYGTETQQQFTDFISQSMTMFTEQQSAFAEQMNDALKGTPMEAWAELGQNQMKAWQEIQQSMFAEKKPDDE